jgi:hypothetical protein
MVSRRRRDRMRGARGVTRAAALAAAAVDIAKSVPDIGALDVLLDIAGQKRLSAALREIVASRPAEVGGKPRPDVEVLRRGRVR